jgi:Protein of unknown function DUF262/HNH endonuclease
MAARTNLVNLDAMIAREDFAAVGPDASEAGSISSISVRDFTSGGLVGPALRKPDFQRETNHWAPEQIVSLLKCFVNNDLIPSVILWKSSNYLFVIDGGHRLSALRAWVQDDYGDGHISQKFFGYSISDAQRKSANRTRELVNKEVGAWKQFEVNSLDSTIDAPTRAKVTAVVSRALQIQWVHGNADKAENSFFMINTQGTPLDELEESLLKNRRKPASIASRAIIRAGTGHRYWSGYSNEIGREIEQQAKKLHTCLFDPELKRPVKTLDLPMGGPKGVRTALSMLIDLLMYVERGQTVLSPTLSEQIDDADGEATVKLLKRSVNLIDRVTGNDKGSLGLHPAVYFYGPTGRHSGPMFMGTISFLARKIANNDKEFFKTFSGVREAFESILIRHKELIATLLQKSMSRNREATYALLLERMLIDLLEKKPIEENDLVRYCGLEGKILLGTSTSSQVKFTDDVKSRVFIENALKGAVRCSVCNGYLDPAKSVSYDHIEPVREGGVGEAENCALTHPYCNQSIKA